jgi:hypothetical protein
MNFKKTCEKILDLSKEENKNDFLKNHNIYKNELDEIDQIINSKSDLDQNMDINELFNLLSEFDEKINNNQITVHEFKQIKDLNELIEKKIQTEKLNVTKIVDDN